MTVWCFGLVMGWFLGIRRVLGLTKSSVLGFFGVEIRAGRRLTRFSCRLATISGILFGGVSFPRRLILVFETFVRGL